MARLDLLVGSRLRAGAAALLLLAALLLSAGVAVGCGSSAPAATPALIQASLLIEADESAPTWHRGIEAPKGVDGYELLETAVDGDLEADWFPEFRAHFVKEILGVAPEGSEFWGVFVWNEGIVKGENLLEPGIPESFNVLVNEMKSLGLNVEMFESDVLTEKPKDGSTEGEEV